MKHNGQTYKRYLAVLTALALSLLLWGCGRGEEATAQPAPTEAPTAAPQTESADDGFAPDFTFTAEDVVHGGEIDETLFGEHKITMVNIWEPWCGPCVGEMPELERLYEDMHSQGVGVLGVYYTEEGAAEVLEECGITYPVIRETPEFYQFESGYVPTSFFVDGSGHVLKSDAADARGILFISSNSYDGWKSVIEGLMSDGEA